MAGAQAQSSIPWLNFEPCESANSSEQAHVPQVLNDSIPKIDQHFRSLDEVSDFYNEYAKLAGFSVRNSTQRKNVAGEITRKEYVCFKEGSRNPKETVNNAANSETVTRKRGLTREGCHARLVVLKDRSEGGFVVTQFIEGHNHEFTSPRRVHLLRSHRKVSAAKRDLTQQLADVNVPTYQQMNILESQCGGRENVGFIQQDLYNVRRDMRKSLDGHDAELLYEYFESEKQKNEGFMYSVKVNDEGRMTHCFWADETCRISYQYFGDVVVFDTTYNTNRYSLIFAPIIGVNHHMQSTLFGCAFLSDETSDSFEWLFNEWLKAMPAGPPKMIITDQDPAMAKAIASALPYTYHRFCIWHIVRKFSEKISAVSYAKHYEGFKKCIWHSQSREEFEANWVEVVGNANLSSNEWLKNMFHIRDRWVPIYMKDVFSAHMTSSQRAESEHSFFKHYVSPTNSLLEFVTRFDRALARIRHNELELDHKDSNEKPLLKNQFCLMESTMSEVYTRKIFYKFQEELQQSVAYVPTKSLKDNHRSLYTVARHGQQSRGREISVEKPSNYVRCSCKTFESDGIPCRHMLAYFHRKGVLELPNEYILRRWTKLAKASRVKHDLGGSGKDTCDASSLVTRNRQFQRFGKLYDDSVFIEGGNVVVDEGLSSIEMKLAEMKLACSSGPYEDAEQSTIQMRSRQESQPSFKEPLRVRAKGCGKRLKGGKEKAVNKGRFCHGCKD